MANLARFFSFIGDDDGEDAVGKAAILRRFLLWEAALHSWFVVLGFAHPLSEWGLLLPAVALTLLALTSVFRPDGAWLYAAACSVMIVRLIYVFPDAYNHLVFECLLMAGCVSTSPPDVDDSVLTLQYCRWLVAIVFVWTGVQKFLHDCYFGGEFLAFATTAHEHFGRVLAWYWSEEFTRLASFGEPAIGSGPYRVSSSTFVLMSNLAWMSEVGLGLLLLVRPWRRYAAGAAILFIVGVEIVALEMVFGLIFVVGLCLFLSKRVLRFSTWVALVGLVVLIGTRVVFPEFWVN